MRNKVIEIAKGEIGYKEGANNANKYSKELYNKSQEWCADFIRWCFIKAEADSLFPISSYVPTVANWFDERGQYKNSKAHGGNYTPQKGDIVLFDYNTNSTSDHIGLVEFVENGQVHTIEGNKDNCVKRCTYNLDSKSIRAYCVPNYNTTEEEKKETEPKIMYVCANGGLNVRNDIGTSSKRVDGLANGSKVTVYEEKDGWSRIGDDRWVCSDYLRENKDTTKTMTVKANGGLNIRSGAGTEYKRVGGLANGSKVTVHYIVNGWAKVDEGYVCAKYLV